MYKFAINVIKKYKLEFIKFVIVGLTATAISYLIYISLLNLMDKIIAYTIGYAISFCFNLIASNLFTFKTKVNVTNGLRFGLAHLTNCIIQLILLNLFTYIGIPELYAPIPVYAIAVPVNFFVVRFALKTSKLTRNKQ